MQWILVQLLQRERASDVLEVSKEIPYHCLYCNDCCDDYLGWGYFAYQGGVVFSFLVCVLSLKGRKGIDGARVEQILDFASITLNKKSVPGDKSALVPGGIRIGSPAMTTRGFTEKEFVPTTDFIHEGVQITLEAKRLVSGSKLQDFLKFVAAADFPLLDNMLNMLNLFSINNICLFGRMHD
uniref:Serine hydroxymethyltransferase-like domain-containing protein n=1 Tax=Quercus lobata TaxID=97700 RepID=A0A7N2KXM5_QUELO